MTAKTMLYDPDKTDQFGIDLDEFGNGFEQFSKDLKLALYQKSRTFSANALLAYGSELDDPRALAGIIGSAFRTAVTFALAAGFIELTGDGQIDLSSPLESEDNVLQMFPEAEG